MWWGESSCQQVGERLYPLLKVSCLSERPKASVRGVAGLWGISGEQNIPIAPVCLFLIASPPAVKAGFRRVSLGADQTEVTGAQFTSRRAKD